MEQPANRLVEALHARHRGFLARLEDPVEMGTPWRLHLKRGERPERVPRGGSPCHGGVLRPRGSGQGGGLSGSSVSPPGMRADSGEASLALGAAPSTRRTEPDTKAAAGDSRKQIAAETSAYEALKRDGANDMMNLGDILDEASKKE